MTSQRPVLDETCAPTKSIDAADGRYTGVVTPAKLPNLEYLGGRLMVDTTNPPWAVDHYRDSLGEMLWLERPISNGKCPRFVVVDVLRISLHDKEVLARACSGKDSPGVIDERFVAIVLDADVEVYDEIRQAWFIDVNRSQFVEIPTTGVKCQNSGYFER